MSGTRMRRLRTHEVLERGCSLAFESVRIGRDYCCHFVPRSRPARRDREEDVDDTQALTTLNDQFIEAFRQGSWELLEPVLSPSFSFLDGASGEVWTHERYVQNLRSHAAPSLSIDQVAVHVDGNAAVVSARTSRQPGRYSRYVDTYERRDEGWRCIHACVWPLQNSN
jgi:Domain of unknown function (DUF4440)